MPRWIRATRSVRVLMLAVALTAFGCPGDDELGLYCQLMALAAGPSFSFEDCYDSEYNPEEFQEARTYFDDVRAYQGLLAQRSITGPGAPSFDAFMLARYPDWPERSARLRAAEPAADASVLTR